MILNLTFCDENLDFILKKLEEWSNISMPWFENNYIKINSHTFNFLV